MSVFDKISESPLLAKLQAAGGKLQANPIFQAMNGGMMGTMSLILTGAVFTIVATLLSLAGIISQDGTLYQWLQVPYNMTMNLLSVPIAFSIAFIYTQCLGKKGDMANGIVSLVVFLMVSAPIHAVTLADGTTANVLSSDYLGGMGIFTALLIAIAVVKISIFCEEHNVTIKMPDVVPTFLVDSFSALIPLIINVVLWRAVAFACETFMGAPLPGIIMGLISIPLAPLTSGPGVIVLALVGQLAWCLGIHGTGVVYSVLLAPMMQAYAANADLVAQGLDPVFSTVFLYGAFATCGGTGNVFPLAVHCLRAKSEKLKAVGKAAVGPAIFNISEPMVFGLPIVYNPIIDVPFIFNPVITALIVWAGYATGFFRAPSVMLMTALPIGMAEFLQSLSVTNVLIPVIAFVVGFIVYAPFVAIYDKQCLAEEAAAEAEELVA